MAAEDPSRTANHQRVEEMLVHLTPLGAVVPYTLCRDAEHHLWVASKGGLFRLEHATGSSDNGVRPRQVRGGPKVLVEQKHPFPKKVSPYVQVLHHDSKIIYAFCDDKENTDFRILSLAGEIQHQHFIGGRVQSLAVNADGDLFMTKQPAPGDLDSTIYRSSMDCPLAWEELSSAYDYAFQALCAYDANTLAVATVSAPVNIYSKQSIKWIDARTGKIVGEFGSAGRADGQIFFPRSMQRYKDDLLVMDKTGRFQRFNRSGELVELSACIDAYIGNGFIVDQQLDERHEGKHRDGEVIVACSGIVQTEVGGGISQVRLTLRPITTTTFKEKESLCDDWLECVRLDGSKWTL